MGFTYRKLIGDCRGNIWWVKIRVEGRSVYESSESTKKSDAIELRDKMLAKRHRGELTGGSPHQFKGRCIVLIQWPSRLGVKPSTFPNQAEVCKRHTDGHQTVLR
jgi:hypothetical protein